MEEDIHSCDILLPPVECNGWSGIHFLGHNVHFGFDDHDKTSPEWWDDRIYEVISTGCRVHFISPALLRKRKDVLYL